MAPDVMAFGRDKPPKNWAFLTVDLEDFRFITRRLKGLSGMPTGEEVADGVNRLLEALRRSQPDAKITFFVTGQLAAEKPLLVRSLADAGHEIACHSYLHENLSSLSRRDFEVDLNLATNVLEEITGKPVLGFRAPSYSVPSDRYWMFEALAERGYLYDSSLLVDTRRLSAAPFDRIQLAGSTLLEFPIYRYRPLRGVSVRAIGGTYFRMLPVAAIRRVLELVAEMGFAQTIWLHPADLQSDFVCYTFGEAIQCGVRAALEWPLFRLRQKIGSRTTAEKLAQILALLPLGGTLGECALEAASTAPDSARKTAT